MWRKWLGSSSVITNSWSHLRRISYACKYLNCQWFPSPIFHIITKKFKCLYIGIIYMLHRNVIVMMILYNPWSLLYYNNLCFLSIWLYYFVSTPITKKRVNLIDNIRYNILHYHVIVLMICTISWVCAL